jgi:hypothetical protein
MGQLYHDSTCHTSFTISLESKIHLWSPLSRTGALFLEDVTLSACDLFAGDVALF